MLSTVIVASIIKNRHNEWRKQVKKLRRKKKRQLVAQKRDAEIEKENVAKLKDPNYLTNLAEQRVLELIQEEQYELERQETHRKWCKYDNEILVKWNEKQEKFAKVEEAKKREILRIQKEFEVSQKALQQQHEEKQRKTEEKLRQHEEFLQKLDVYMYGGKELPAELMGSADTNPGKAPCPFFNKTSSCRFGDKCSRNHSRPNVSPTLSIPNFFSHIRLEQGKPTEYGNDFVLEYDEDELYRDFMEFFNDVVPEFEQFGIIEQFFVCNNQEAHLRGHAYIEFRDQRDSIKAYRHMQGRYYAGRMLNVEFCTINSWKSAICGLSFTNKCPKGRSCNFLHVFKNPNNRFPLKNRAAEGIYTNHKITPNLDKNESWDDDNDKHRNWRWSESPEHDYRKSKKFTESLNRKENIEKHRQRSCSRDRKYRYKTIYRSRNREKSSEKTARKRSQERKQSTDKNRSRRKERSRERRRNRSKEKAQRKRSRDNGRRSRSKHKKQKKGRC